MNITLQGINLKISSRLHEFALRKIRDCQRAFGDMNLESVSISVELECTNRRRSQSKENEQLYRAIANVSMPGHPIRVEESAMEIEQAVVKLKHTLTREIRHRRERLIVGSRKGARQVKDMLSEDIDNPSHVEKPELWEEEWALEEEKAKQLTRQEEDKKWEDWAEEEDLRDYS